MDEPLAGLDPVGKKKMLDILRALHRDAGITVVVVSHDADAVVEDAEQVLYLKDGKIMEQGAPADIFYRLWLREMEQVTRNDPSGMTGGQTLEKNAGKPAAGQTGDKNAGQLVHGQTRDRSTRKSAGEVLSEALCELPVCMQLLIRLRMMGLPVSCKHTLPAETVQAIADAVGR